LEFQFYFILTMLEASRCVSEIWGDLRFP
jgi:hypothetical protein